MPYCLLARVGCSTRLTSFFYVGRVRNGKGYKCDLGMQNLPCLQQKPHLLVAEVLDCVADQIRQDFQSLFASSFKAGNHIGGGDALDDALIFGKAPPVSHGPSGAAKKQMARSS